MKCLIVFALVSVSSSLAAIVSEKHDLSLLPPDLLPVTNLVGRWSLQSVTGNADWIKPADLIDFGINPIPLFGSRALNITAHYFSPGSRKHDQETMYGFMPVANATRFDPRVHTAFLTTYSNGMNIIEQGWVIDNRRVKTHLKQFMKRTFGMGRVGTQFVVDELEREIRFSPSSLEVKVESLTNWGRDSYTAQYVKDTVQK